MGKEEKGKLREDGKALEAFSKGRTWDPKWEGLRAKSVEDQGGPVYAQSGAGSMVWGISWSGRQTSDSL